METKHTKGEWYLNGDSVYVDAKTKKGRKIIAMVFTQDFKGKKITEVKRNAKLLAAAPDLLEALNRLCDEYIANRGTKDEFITCITPEYMPEYWKKAQEAIKKATA